MWIYIGTFKCAAVRDSAMACPRYTPVSIIPESNTTGLSIQNLRSRSDERAQQSLPTVLVSPVKK